MSEYKRLTERMSDGKGNPNCSECEHYKTCGDEWYCDDGESCYQKIFDRLAELEDKIEQGTLKEAKKAEILVKPDTEFGLGTDWYCGNCGGFLNKFIHGNYCRYCGAELIIPKEQQNG